MKVQIEIECTPEEARRFMGLPDVDQANEAYVDSVSEAMKGATSAEQFQDIAKQLAPMGQMGLKMFQNFMENRGSFSDKDSYEDEFDDEFEDEQSRD